MKRYCFVVFFIFALAHNGFSQEESITLTFYDHNQQVFYSMYFQYVHFPYTENGIFMDITYNLNLLRSILQIERLKIDVIRDNLENEGPSYKRKYVGITLEDGIRVIEDDTHTQNQFNDLVNATLLYNSIVDYIQRNNRGIIIEKLPVNWLMLRGFL